MGHAGLGPRRANLTHYPCEDRVGPRFERATHAMATTQNSTSTPGKRRARRAPNLSMERALFEEGHLTVGGLDEVGRGAWAGPLLVGVVVIDASVGRVPKGTADSKLLAPEARESLRPALVAWCRCWAAGTATAREIDELGLSVALTLAARRALGSLEILPDALIVDGTFDFVRRDDVAEGVDDLVAAHGGTVGTVRTAARADRSSATVAAASILAKVARDRRMATLSRKLPGYGFEHHKGYGTPAHATAIAAHGLTALHRRSWTFAEPEEVE